MNTVRDTASTDVIDSLAVDGSLTVGVTSLEQEAVTTVDVIEKSSVARALCEKEIDFQDLTRYLARPVCISSGNLPTGSRARIFSFDVSIANDILNRYVSGINRVSGAFGMRFTTVYTMQVAATPFHQGVFTLSFQYGAVAGDTDKTYIRSSNAATVTNLPHTRVDISEVTTAVLRVPFLYGLEYLPVILSNDGMVSAFPRYGTFALNGLLPVETVAGMNAPQYQVFMHLEDVEFFGAKPQSTTAITLQSGGKMSKFASELEDDGRPFSSAVHALSRTVRFVGKGIPSLSSIAGPTSWFLAKTAGALRAFGFSRPAIQEPVNRMVQFANVNEFNTDLPSAAQVVGPFASNTLAHSSDVGYTNVDEMSLSYVLSQWSQINYFKISNTTTGAIFVMPVSPSCTWFRSAQLAGTALPSCNTFPRLTAQDVTNNAFQPSSLFYFSSMFKYWRGGIKLRFTFAKTKMHAGRVMVTYNPVTGALLADDNNYGTLPTIGAATYGASGPDPFGYSAVFDLKDGNVFEYEVPYVTPAPYVNWGNSTGTVAMYVVNPVQASSVVSNTISVLVEVCASEDFEVADVRSPLYPPSISGVITVQSGGSLKKQDPCELTIGECVTSLRTLVAVPHVEAVARTAGAVSRYAIPPWYYQPRLSTALLAPTSFPHNTFSFGGCIASCYAFVRGGTDVHAYDSQRNTSLMGIAQFARVLGSASDINARSPRQHPSSSMPRVISNEGQIHARLPAYQKVGRFVSYMYNSVVAPATSWALNDNVNPTLPTLSIVDSPNNIASLYHSNTAACVLTVSRAASDDASCAMYVGPPPAGLLATNTAGFYYDPDSSAMIS